MRNRKTKKSKVIIIMLYIAAAAGLLYSFHPLVHALGKKVMTVEIGEEGSQVEASLSENGTLTISGKGRIRDYTEETSPFAEYADRITAVKIGDGVTSIGDYLLYNCGNLKGKLVLPSSVIWVGDYAFSGDDRDHAPEFRVVESRFQEGRIARRKPGESKPEKPKETDPTETAVPATPGEATPGPGMEETTGTGGAGNAEETTDTEAAGNAEETADSGAAGNAEETTDSGAAGNAEETADSGSAGNAEETTDSGAAGNAEETTDSGAAGNTEETIDTGATGNAKKTADTGAAGNAEKTADTGATGNAEKTIDSGLTGNAKKTADSRENGILKEAARAGEAGSMGEATIGGGTENQDSKAVYTSASRHLSGILKMFSLGSMEENGEDTEKSEASEEENADDETPEKETETSAPVKHPSATATDSEAGEKTEDGETAEEATEEDSEDTMLSNDLYEEAVDPAELSEEELKHYTIEILTAQIIGSDIFYSGQNGAYECEAENVSFAEAAEMAGYRKADGYVEVDMEGIRETFPVIDGMFFAPELPEEIGKPEDGDDPLFANQFTGWTVSSDWETLGYEAPVYPPGTGIPVESLTTTVSLYANWENTCTLDPQVEIRQEESNTIYQVIDANTGNTIPTAEQYQIHYQWQICRPIMTSSADEDGAVLAEENAGPGAVSLKNDLEPEPGPGVVVHATDDLAASGDSSQTVSSPVGPGVSPQTTGSPVGPGVTPQTSSSPVGPGVSPQTASSPVGPGVSPQTIGSPVGPGVSSQASRDLAAPEDSSQTASDPAAPGDSSQASRDSAAPGDSSQTTSDPTPAGDPSQTTGNPAAPEAEAQVSNNIHPSEGNAWNISDSPEETIDLNNASEQLTTADPADESSWEDIDGANEGVYTRLAEPTDKLSYFRVMVSVEKATFFRSASEPAQLFSTPVLGKSARQMISVTYLPGDGAAGTAPVSDPVTDGYSIVPVQNPFTRTDGKEFVGWAVSLSGVTAKTGDGSAVAEGTVIPETQPVTLTAVSTSNPSVTFTAKWSEIKTVYVDGTNGNDGNDGATTATAVQTLTAAYGKLDSAKTVMENRIILCGTYTTGGITLPATPATISGRNPDGSIGTLALNGDITCSADTTIEELTVTTSGRSVWARGHKLVMGYGLTMSSGVLNLYGGNSGGTLNGSANLTVCSGRYNYIALSYNFTNTTGDFNVTVLGGTISSVYGGYYSNGISSSVCLTGDFNVKVYGGQIGMLRGTRFAVMNGSVHYEIYGGGITDVVGGPHSGDRARVNGPINISIHGGTCGTVYGGAFDSSSGSVQPCLGGVNLNMDGGTVTGDFICGGYGAWYKAIVGSIKGDIHAELTGGKIGGNLYGGCAMDFVIGNVTIDLSDVEITGNVYGGGKGGRNNDNNLIYSDTRGNTTINVGSGTVVGGSIYGGIDSYGTISGNVTINYSGTLGANGAGGSLYGGGRGSESAVTGTTDITVNPGAAVADNVYGGGDQGKVTGGTTVRLAGGDIGGSIFGAGNNIGTGSASVILSGTTAIGGAIYGGSNNAGTTDSTQVTLKSATDRDIYGGGFGADTTVTAATVTTEAGVSAAGSVFGGGNQGNTVDTTVNIDGDVSRAFGGGNKAGATGTVKVNVNSGAAAGDIYGGSNDQGETHAPIVAIAGKAANVYGGGLGEGTTTASPKVTVLSGAEITGNLYGGGSAGIVTGGATVSIEGGTVKAAYGGGNSAGITGAVTVTTQPGSTVTTLYGGSNSTGTVESPVLTVQGTATTVYASGNGPDTITKFPAVNAGNGAVITSLYGGGEMGKTENGSTVNLKSGSRCENVYGGGNAAGVTGQAAIHAESGSRTTNLYGGSNSSGTVDSTKLTIDGAVGGTGQPGTTEAPGAIYGGGLGEDTRTVATAVVIGSTGVVNGEVFGGGAKGPVTGDTSVILESSGTVNGHVYAGGDAAVVNGSTWLEARDLSVIKGSLYGGGKGTTAEIGTDTRVLAFAHITGNVFGGGAEGKVLGNTHVDIAKGAIEGDGVNTGNVFGGSDKAKVKGNTQVHIGWEAASGTETDVTNATLLIKGTVFGGGNTTDTGSNFDASDPFVEGSATVSVDASNYDTANFNIEKSILGDGNMCTVKGARTVAIKNYKALGDAANTSLQRADILTLETSQIELIGAIDSANLVPTIAYSLNRIDKLIMRGGSTLRIQTPVNLVKNLISQDSSGNPVTTTATTEIAAEPAIKNQIDIQQGVQMELRTSEDVTTMQYGTVSGYMLLDAYDPDPSKEIESGIYVLGNYAADESLGGFLYGSGDSRYKKIDPSTDEANWRNWAIGTDMKKDIILVMSDKPAGGKIAELESPWPADGSIYRLVSNTAAEKNHVTITSIGDKFVLKDPSALDSDPDTTLGISIQAGNQGWVNPMTMGYILGDSDNGADGGGYGGLTTESMQTLNNRSIKPKILVELTNRNGISKTDEDHPLTVSFQLENVRQLSDGGFSKQGTLTVNIQIRRESLVIYDDILISPGKEYVRAIQDYTFATMEGKAGATISQKSAVTLQYGKKDSGGAAASSHKLKFSHGDTPSGAGAVMKLPAGVTILAVDRSGSDPVYAHYTVPSGGVEEVDISQFVKNGSDENYSHSGSYFDKENYLFILDFANAPDGFSQDKMCVTFETVYGTGSSAAVNQAKILFSVTSGQPGYNISSSEATGPEHEGNPYDREAAIPLTLNTYAEGGGVGVDTTGTEAEMGAYLRLRSRDTGVYVPVPTDWFVTQEGKKTGELTGSGIAVILGNGMMNSTSSLGINMKPGTLSAGKYQWEIYLTSASLAAYPGLLTETPLYLNFSITDKRYSIKADYKDPSASCLYPSISTEPRPKLELKTEVKLENGAVSEGVVKRASLWKKDQTTGEYSRIDFSLLFEGISGTGKDYSLEEDPDPYTLKPSLPEGTYRLKYELIQTGGGADQLLTYDTENFIVTP